MIKNLYHKHSIYTVVESIFKSVSSYIPDFLKNLLFSVFKLLYSQSVFISFLLNMQEPLITIGLEIHLKLASQTKIFCKCKNEQALQDNQPNTTICPVCTWQPWALPQLSAEVVEKGLLLGKALQCQFNNPSYFDRKSYFYPDLPMGYQITQLYTPINVKGSLSFFFANYEEEKQVRISDAHLECDTAKAFHQGGAMLLDFNRAGTPLIEIVTGPDFTSAEQAVEFAKEIQRIAKRNNLSDADMEKGQMRVDVNVSIRKEKSDPLGTRVELKNINSFSAIKRAIDAEVIRQAKCRETGEEIQQQTRRRDDLKWQSFAMRSKEDALDYRYFPEPDLLPLYLDEQLLKKVEEAELVIPFQEIKKMKSEYWFHKEFINALIGEYPTLTFFKQLIHAGFEPKLVAKRIAGQISGYMTAHFVNITELPVDQEQLVEFFNIAKEGKLIDNQLKLIMEEMLQTGASASDIIKEKGFDTPEISESDLRAFCKEVLDENPAILDQYKAGKTSVIGFFVGQVMRKTQGKANPQAITKILLSELG